VATINELDDASLEKVVRRSEELATLAPENPEYVSILGPQTYADPKTYVPATAAITPKMRADAVAQSLKYLKMQSCGCRIFGRHQRLFPMMNSKGLQAYNTSTNH